MVIIRTDQQSISELFIVNCSTIADQLNITNCNGINHATSHVISLFIKNKIRLYQCVIKLYRYYDYYTFIDMFIIPYIDLFMLSNICLLTLLDTKIY